MHQKCSIFNQIADDNHENNEIEFLLWYMKYDSNETVMKIAVDIWNGHHLNDNCYHYLLPLIRHRYNHIRTCAAKAIAGAILNINDENTSDKHSSDDDAEDVGYERSDAVINDLCEMFTQHLPQRNERAAMLMMKT